MNEDSLLSTDTIRTCLGCVSQRGGPYLPSSRFSHSVEVRPPRVYQRAPEGHRPLEADSLAAPLEMSDDNLGLRQSSAVIRDTSHISRKQFHLSLQDTVKAALHRAAEIKSKYSRLLPDIQTDLAAQINAIQSGYRPDQFDIAAWSLLLFGCNRFVVVVCFLRI